MNKASLKINEKNKIYEGLKNTDWAEILYDAINLEKNRPQYIQHLGWEWWEVQAHPNTLKKMVSHKLVFVTHAGKRTYYKVNPVAKKLFKKEMQESKSVQQLNNISNNIPNDLFENIVAHDQAKWLLEHSIQAKEPCHVLLYGEPATAKTLFLSELSRLPNSRFILGSSTSKAGLVDYLLEYQVKFLILDEIDKMNNDDMSALLSLMESGMVSRLKKKMRETIYLQTWVFGSANKINHLPAELKSRFWIYYVAPYNEKDFKAISQTLLEKYFNDKEIIDYIVDQILNYTRDIRTVQKIGKLCEKKEDIDYILKML